MRFLTISWFKNSFRIEMVILLFALFAVLFSAIDSFAGMTREEAKQIIIERVITGDPNKDKLMAFGPQNMLITGDIVAPFIVGRAPFPGVSRIIDKDTWFFWINDDINDLFAHPTRFVYIDANHTDPTIGDGIIIDEAGWWPRINGIDHYRYSADRNKESTDWVYGQLPEEPQEKDVLIPFEKQLSESLANNNSSNTYAIIISGESDGTFEASMDHFQSAVQNNITGPDINTNNIIRESNCSYNNFTNHINTINSNGADTLYIFLTAHGDKEGVVLNGLWRSSEEIADAIEQSNVSNVNVITECCYDGTLADEIQATGVADTIITATDGEHPATGRGYWVLSSGGSFSKELCEHWQDGSDTITLEEAYQRVVNAECAWWDIWCEDVQKQGPTITHSGSSSIPTLSEWKQIFLTLLLLASGLFFIRRQSSTSNIRSSVFELEIYKKIMLCIMAFILMAYSIITLVFGSISALDIIGVLFCAPLLGYIIHLIVLSVKDYNTDQIVYQ